MYWDFINKFHNKTKVITKEHKNYKNKNEWNIFKLVFVTISRNGANINNIKNTTTKIEEEIKTDKTKAPNSLIIFIVFLNNIYTRTFYNVSFA